MAKSKVPLDPQAEAYKEAMKAALHEDRHRQTMRTLKIAVVGILLAVIAVVIVILSGVR